MIKKACRYIGEFLLVPALLAGVCTCLGLLGFLGWPLELASHFFVQYLLFLALALPFLFFLPFSRLNRLLLACLSLALVADVVAVQRTHFGRLFDTGKSGRQITLIQFNVNTANSDFQAFDKLLAKHNPDFVCLEEIGPDWERHLRGLEDKYPYQVRRAREDNFGIALMSKHKLDAAQILPLGEAGLPTIVTKFTWPDNPGQKQFNLVVTHPTPPLIPDYCKWRDNQLKVLASGIKGEEQVILAGDLNCTPWSYAFRDFCKSSGNLVDCRVDNKPISPLDTQATWPMGIFPLRIPIDYVLLKGPIRCLEMTVEEPCGSDHLPVVVRLEAGR